MMFAVLGEVDRLGGEVSRRRFLEIGERHGYSHRGMAGYYQQLVEAVPGYKTRLTATGRERLRPGATGTTRVVEMVKGRWRRHGLVHSLALSVDAGRLRQTEVAQYARRRPVHALLGSTQDRRR